MTLYSRSKSNCLTAILMRKSRFKIGVPPIKRRAKMPDKIVITMATIVIGLQIAGAIADGKALQHFVVAIWAFVAAINSYRCMHLGA